MKLGNYNYICTRKKSCEEKMRNNILRNLKIILLISLIFGSIVLVFFAIQIGATYEIKYWILYFIQFIALVGIAITITLYRKYKEKIFYDRNLENIVQDRTQEIRKANDKFVDELEYARSIQQSLLPLRNLKFEDATFLSAYFPCSRLSGDFYDIYRIDENSVGMYVLDVSGHGISAALMTMFCNNFIKSPERIVKKYRGLKPHRNLSNFYEEFNKVGFPSEMYMVMMYASYNLRTNIMTYCSGGLNSIPLVIRKNGGIEYLDKSLGFPICKMEDVFVPEYESAKIQLYKGDRVIFYTDGLFDDMQNGVLDEGEFKTILNMCRNEELDVLYNQIQSQILPKIDKLDDDVTYFIMEV